VRFRLLVVGLTFSFLLAACGDAGDDGGLPDATTSVPTGSIPTASGPPVTRDPEGIRACRDLAERYVQRSRALFDGQGTPSDALVERVRARLEEFDAIAGTAGCGEEYLRGVCEGLDGLTAEGLLVILPLTTAQCL
jgi:hypothetical protein